MSPASIQQTNRTPGEDCVRIFLIALMGAAGTLARYWLQGIIQYRSGSNFPFGTLVVNLSGCLLLGFLAQLTFNRMIISPEWRIAMTIGFFGGYTTFSTFGWETAKMLQDGEWLHATVYVAASMVAGLLLTLAGIHAANRI